MINKIKTLFIFTQSKCNLKKYILLHYIRKNCLICGVMTDSDSEALFVIYFVITMILHREEVCQSFA